MGASLLIVQHVVLFKPVEGVSRVKARHQHLVNKNLVTAHGSHDEAFERVQIGLRSGRPSDPRESQ